MRPAFDVPWRLLPGPVAVVDVETTGFSPVTDRVVEVAVIRMEEERRWRILDTLVNPEGPVTATFVHGIRAADVKDAPTFADIIPYLSAVLEGAVLVAHNASFDRGFLSAELARAGGCWDAPELCTMLLARQCHPERSGQGAHKLENLVALYGIDNPAPHRALGDAYATAALLARLLSRGNTLRGLIRRSDSETQWPPMSPRRSTLKPRGKLDLPW